MCFRGKLFLLGLQQRVDSGTLCIGVTSSILQEDTNDLVKCNRDLKYLH